MKKAYKLSALLVISFLGILSILATSPPPYGDGFLVFSENNPPASSLWVRENAYVCLNDTVKIKATFYESSQITLNVRTPENTFPPLNNYTLTPENPEVSVQVLGNVEFDPTSNMFDNPKLGLIPEELCNDFPLRIIGWYKGQLEQETPSTASLVREFRLFWDGASLKAHLDTTILDTLGYQEDYLNCQAESQSNSLNCSLEKANGDTLKILGTFTEDGLKGTYEGQSSTETLQAAFKGQFSFTKQNSWLELPETP